MGRALVTGCAGFIGSHLTESLLEDGLAVVGVDCFNPNYDRAVKLENLSRARDFDAFQLVESDVSLGGAEELVADADVVFHLAGEPGVRASWGRTFDRYLQNNVLATQLLLEAARTEPERRFVYASSSSIYGQAEGLPTCETATPRPFSPYGVTKLAAEHLCSLYHGNYGLETVSLRYFSVYGPRQRPDMAFHRFCRAALEGTTVRVYGDGRQTRDFTYVADIVAATRAAATSPAAAGCVYNVGGGSRVSVNGTLRLLEDLAGRAISVDYVARERGDVTDTAADTARAAKDLGFAPGTTLESGLQAELAWTESRVRGEAGAAIG